MWVKSLKYGIVTAALDLFRGQEAAFTAIVIGLRGQSVSPVSNSMGSASSITIPMPRSAKSGRVKSPPMTPSTNTVLNDPAVVMSA